MTLKAIYVFICDCLDNMSKDVKTEDNLESQTEQLIVSDDPSSGESTEIVYKWLKKKNAGQYRDQQKQWQWR